MDPPLPRLGVDERGAPFLDEDPEKHAEMLSAFLAYRDIFTKGHFSALRADSKPPTGNDIRLIIDPIYEARRHLTPTSKFQRLCVVLVSLFRIKAFDNNSPICLHFADVSDEQIWNQDPAIHHRIPRHDGDSLETSKAKGTELQPPKENFEYSLEQVKGYGDTGDADSADGQVRASEKYLSTTPFLAQEKDILNGKGELNAFKKVTLSSVSKDYASTRNTFHVPDGESSDDDDDDVHDACQQDAFEARPANYDHGLKRNTANKQSIQKIQNWMPRSIMLPSDSEDEDVIFVVSKPRATFPQIDRDGDSVLANKGIKLQHPLPGRPSVAGKAYSNNIPPYSSNVMTMEVTTQPNQPERSIPKKLDSANQIVQKAPQPDMTQQIQVGMLGKDRGLVSSYNASRGTNNSELPFKVQHALLAKIQKLLEEALFDFAEKWLPHILRDMNWETAEQGELNKWWNFIKNCKVPSVAVKFGGVDVEALFRRVSQIRHAAVHRLPTPTIRIKINWFPDALLLASCIKDNQTWHKLKQLQTALLTDDLMVLAEALDVPGLVEELEKKQNTSTANPLKRTFSQVGATGPLEPSKETKDNEPRRPPLQPVLRNTDRPSKIPKSAAGPEAATVIDLTKD